MGILRTIFFQLRSTRQSVSSFTNRHQPYSNSWLKRPECDGTRRFPLRITEFPIRQHASSDGSSVFVYLAPVYQRETYFTKAIRCSTALVNPYK